MMMSMHIDHPASDFALNLPNYHSNLVIRVVKGFGIYLRLKRINDRGTSNNNDPTMTPIFVLL